MAARNSIPVPGEQRGQGGRRRPSVRDTTQAPWRSSLDLVWSYSRSQAFYGDNIATSPSFVDRHWAGPSGNAIDSSVEEEVLTSEYDDEEEDDDYYDDDEASVATREVSDGYGALDDHTPAGDMEWGEPLPPNAIARRGQQQGGGAMAGGVALGRRERRGSARDRRLSRLADEEMEDDERSRSRSRSPKRLGATSGRRGVPPALRSALHDESSVSSTSSGVRRASRFSHSGLSASEVEADAGRGARESTPLLQTRRLSKSGLAAASSPTARRGDSAFAKASGMSSGARFAAQGYGGSTFWQSWFNTVNALVGVGILALPLALAYAGWVPGIILFLLSGLLTNYTGKVLASIMSQEPNLRTYADIGSYAFGSRARLVVSAFFCIELWAVATALVILFGDSTYALAQNSPHATNAFASALVKMGLETWPPAAFKALGLAIVLPTIFLPLSLLSPISVVGIISVLTLFGVVLTDGLLKHEAPGSLWQPAPTSVGPNWSKLPLAFGLIMSGFSAHPIIPSLNKDLRDPRQFPRMLDLAYVAATIIYLSMGAVGYLLFGSAVSSEITQDLSRTKGYPKVLNKIAIWMIVVSALSKFALAVRPINTTVELLFGVEKSQAGRPSLAKRISSKVLRGRQGQPAGGEEEAADSAVDITTAVPSASGAEPDGSTTPIAAGHSGEHPNPLAGSAISIRAADATADWSPRTRALVRTAVRVVIAALIGLTAILLPGFEKVMAFLGAFLAFSTCVFGPILANLKLNHAQLPRARIIVDIVILSISLVFAVTGTIWAFLPGSQEP